MRRTGLFVAVGLAVGATCVASAVAQPTTPAPASAASLTMPMLASAASLTRPTPASAETQEPAAPEPATPEPATPEPATPEQAAPEREPGAELSVSLITVGAGPLVWEMFGHNAIRIRDSARGLDVAYNWGMFDFNQEGFFWRFLLGDCGTGWRACRRRR